MSDARWTEQQLKAINTRNCNLLVAAAAGSGKTAVLVERLIRRITDCQEPVDVDRLLVVTFTKAAAAEMRERIGSAIEKELNLTPGSRHLLRQATLLNKSDITNLHSFCLDLLRQYFYRIDLDPSFRVADDTEAELLRLEVLEELFEELYASADENFYNLVDAYGGSKDDSNLQTIVLKLYNFSVSNPWPRKWLEDMTQNYLTDGATIEGHQWGKTLLNWLILQLEGFRAKLERAIVLALTPSGPAIYVDNLRDDLTLIDDLIRAANCSWQDIYETINSLEFKTLKRCGKDVDENLKEKVKNSRDDIKKKLNKIKTDYFQRSPVECLNDLHNMHPLILTLTNLVTVFSEKYHLAKTEKAMVDFGDLEHYCLQILMDENSTPDNITPSPVAIDLREKFIEVMVDEYQDINAVQETILRLVSRQDAETPNLFMVGDVKQSIYRFRLAEPGLFMDKYQNYPRETGQPNQGVDLACNFRSRKEVVNAVNYIFKQLMTPRVGEMEYDEKAELVCGADFLVNEFLNTATGPIELHLLEKKSGHNSSTTEDDELTSDSNSEIADDTAETTEELDAIQREARLVAYKISELVNVADQNPLLVFDKKLSGYRPVRYQDIVILMRATSGSANTYLEEFRQLGIPAYADMGTGYFDAIEVETMMSLLKVIDNPLQDIPLAAVLRSPVVGLNAEEMASIRLLAPHENFFDAIKIAAFSDDENVSSIRQRINLLLEQLEEWRTSARRGPLSELIWKLYLDTGYFSYVGGMPGGDQRQANLRALHDRARQFESTNYRGLFRFLRFIEKFQQRGNDLGTARALGENEDVVRIMSIHKSKGLEFPIVFVVGLGKQFNTTDLKATALMHKELGLGLPVVDTELRTVYPNLIQAAIKKRHMMELLAEEMRILYVALTRAREKLILVGSANKLDNSIVKWCDNISHNQWPLPDADLANAKTYLDWIAPAIARHQDGELLRKTASTNIPDSVPTLGDPSSWQVFIWPPDSCFEIELKVENDNQQLLDKVFKKELLPSNDLLSELITQRLDWQYPNANLIGKSAKVAVTEVKRRFADQLIDDETDYAPFKPSINARPSFLQKKSGLSPAEKGSALHLVMQHLDFYGDLSSEGIKQQIDYLTKRELLTPEQSVAIDNSLIVSFFSSNLGQRILQASSIKRELPFTLALPANKIYPGLTRTDIEEVIVQGVIDCLFEDEKGLILLDYKTDRITDQTDISTLQERYSGQVNLYAMAVEAILKKPVTEKFLYLFASGESLQIL